MPTKCWVSKIDLKVYIISIIRRFMQIFVHMDFIKIPLNYIAASSVLKLDNDLFQRPLEIEWNVVVLAHWFTGIRSNIKRFVQ